MLSMRSLSVAVRRVVLYFVAAACLMTAQSRAAWGLKFEVSKDGGATWSSHADAQAGDVIKFRFGTYFDVGTPVTTADGTGGAALLNRFTGSNQWTNFTAGSDVIQSLVRTISNGNAALLSNTGNGTIGGTAATSFGSNLALASLPADPVTYTEIYRGEIKIMDGTARTLTFQNKTFGVAPNTKGATFYNYGSPTNKLSGLPDIAKSDITASISVGCTSPGVTGPSPQAVCAGSQASFSVSATFGPVTFQWRKNTNPIAGQTQNSLTLNAVNEDDEANYDVVVTNSCGSTTSTPVALTVYTPPTIFAQPVSTVVRPGTPAGFSVVAFGGGPLQYHWQKNNAPLSDGGRISGSLTSILTIANAQPDDGAAYTCVVTDPLNPICNTTTTAAAQLSVGDCTISWAQVASSGPGARRNPALAYDSARGRLVLFGGSNNSATLGDTWEWDGSTWTLRSTSGPGPRTGVAMAFDAAHGRMLLFGGYNASSQAQNDTWSWDGTVWTKVATTGPTARFYSTMAFDSVRGEVILFGGLQQNFGLPGDTWAWDGTKWVSVSNSGPAGRYAGAMAFDSVRQRIVMFGGFNVTSINFADTWEWDGVAWSKKADGTPTARTGASLAFDPGRGRIIMFGGRLQVEDEIAWSTRTWEWDGATWVSNLTGVPSARWIAGMALDTSKQRIVLFGGEDSNGGLLGDTWELAARIPITQQPTSVSTNFGQNAAFNVAATGTGLTYRWRKNGTNLTADARITGVTTPNLLITQAGLQDEGAYDVVINSLCGQEISQQALLSVASCPSSWQDLQVASPSARYDGNAASDIPRKQIVIFGGRSSTGLLGDTWVWNGNGWAQKVVSGPSARSDHAMASLASGVLLFGGRDTPGNINKNDTWLWNGSTWALLSPAHSPPALAAATMSYDSVRDRVVLFSGVKSGDIFSNETWEWDGTDWTQVATSGPAPRFAHSMTFDSARGKTVMFGGALFFGTVFFDTWEWDGVTWTKKYEGGPPSQVYGSLTFDPLRGRSIYVGGYTYNRVFSSETWEWNGTIWAKSLSAGPSPREIPYVAYDYQRSRLVLFGGSNPGGTLLNDSWGLILGPSVVTPPQNQVVASTHTAIFSVSGSAPGLQYQWLRNGVNMVDGGRITGTHTSSLKIAISTAQDVASYRVRVTDACGSNVISAPATLTVTCVSDLNGDGVVEDADFSIFVIAYDELLCDPAPAACPADLNADGFVDDSDFTIFVVAYDLLECP